MFPKPGDVAEVSNFGLLQSYELHTTCLSSWCTSAFTRYWMKNKAVIKWAFAINLGVDHAFAVLETMVGSALNDHYGSPTLICERLLIGLRLIRFSMPCLTKVCHCHIFVLSTRYQFPSGHLKDGRWFRIQRGVKQGDVLSPRLFNTGSENAFRNWNAKLTLQGLHVGFPERLSNATYADDIVMYANTSDELVVMMESLIQELDRIGLRLNPHKTKRFTTSDVESPLYFDICGNMVEVLMPDSVLSIWVDIWMAACFSDTSPS